MKTQDLSKKAEFAYIFDAQELRNDFIRYIVFAIDEAVPGSKTTIIARQKNSVSEVATIKVEYADKKVEINYNSPVLAELDIEEISPVIFEMAMTLFRNVPLALNNSIANAIEAAETIANNFRVNNR